MLGFIFAIWIFSSTCLAKATPPTAPKAPRTFLNITELAACTPPSIRITVISPGSAGETTTTALSVPLFTDCTYQTTTQVTPGQAVPSEVISSSADYSQYVDANGNALDKNSLNTFLEFFGDSVDLDIILEQTACGITDANNNIDTIQSDNEALNNGNSVEVLNYQCITELLDS